MNRLGRSITPEINTFQTFERVFENKAWSGLNLKQMLKEVKGFTYNFNKGPHYSRNETIEYLQSLGYKIKGKSPGGRFIEFVDKKGRIRAKIHPPDKITNFNHLHLYDEKGNALNSKFKIAHSRSSGAHIKIGE